MIPLRALQQIVSAPVASVAPRVAPPSPCELCGAPLGEPHRHVVELDPEGGPPRRVACACGACAILFAHGQGATALYRTVPTRVLVDDRCALRPQTLVELGIPVGLAVFFTTAKGAPIGLYPGAAGVVEAELSPEVWEALRSRTTVAAIAESEVEAVLVHAERGSDELACFLVPIDVAYDLAGRLRRTWRGFSGGDEARRELSTFFDELRRRSRPRGAR
jgi:hypothetical protein